MVKVQDIISIINKKRGWTDSILQQLRNPAVTDLHDPFLLENMGLFVDVLHRYKDQNITVIPDYDADGILSGSLLMASLSVLGFKHFNLYEPRIQTGYGMTIKSTKEALSQFPDTNVIITTDNGSNAHDGVNYALSQNVDVLITDHHQADSGDPVLCVVNPNRPTDTYLNKGLSGTAVIWKAMQAYALKYGNARDRRLIDLLIVLVGMSVISDVMPLLDENRYCVKQSIEMLQNPTLLKQGSEVSGYYGSVFRGLYALYNICNEKGKFNYGFDESTLGFVFGPMLNSPRRMSGSSKQGFNLLLNNSYDEALKYGEELFEINEKRKQLMRKYNQEYMSPIHPSNDKLSYMIGVVPYRPGLIGLIAGRFTNDVGLPSIVFGNMNLSTIHYHGDLPDNIDVISGSARSPEWFDMHGALTQISVETPEWFVSFGGHKQAAGVGLHAEYYESFRLRFKELVLERMVEVESEMKDLTIENDPTTWIGYNPMATQPFDILLENLTDTHELLGVVEYINELKPYGQAIREPDFGVHFNTKDTSVSFMGSEKQHVRFVLPNQIEIIQWNGASPLRQQLGHQNGPFNLTVRGSLSVNEFMGRTTIQIIADQLTINK